MNFPLATSDPPSGWLDGLTLKLTTFLLKLQTRPGWLDGVQLALGALGMAPVVGEVFDLADAGISYARGDYPGASLSMAAAIPGIGNVAGAGKLANRLNKLTKKVSGGTANSAQGALLKEHLRQSQKYGKGSIRELSDGRYRYYDKLKPPKKAGEMAGQRKVREWGPCNWK